MNNYIVTFEYSVMVTAFAILAMFCDSCSQIIVDCVSNIAVNNKRRSGLKGAGQVSYSIQTPLTHKNRCNDVPTGETGRSWKNV